MKRALVLMALCSAAWAQAPRGQQVFQQTCGSGYCHGTGGAGGGAPRLAARGFTQAFIENTAKSGVAGTSMPSFAQSLSQADFNAVVAYVAGLNGVPNGVTTAATRATAGPPAKLAPAAEHGRALFSDSVRSFARCSTCHEVGGRGIPVAAPMSAVPASVAALKALATPRVVTATVGGDSMPALVVAKKASGVTFYDLTVAPPVLRTVTAAEFQSRDASEWRHSGAMGKYSDAELGDVLSYLRVGAR